MRPWLGRLLSSERGASLIVAIFLIVIVGFFGAMMGSFVSTQNFTALNEARSTQALYVADGGLERALYAYRNGAPCNTLAYVAVPLGSGNFTTTGTLYNPASTTLSAPGITNIVTTIPVASTVGYAPYGRIRIESEEITYAAIVGNTFTGARRGTVGTVAAAHVTGVPVSQNLCMVRSTGNVPGAVGAGQRVVETAEGGTSVSQGSFAKQVGLGAQTITGVGFQPKAVIFFGTRQTVAGFTAAYNTDVGFATGAANERVISITARDGTGRSDEGRRRSDTNVILILDGGGPPTAVLGQAGLTSFNADGFTINWTVNDGVPYLIHYIALGGDITNALASTFNLSTAGGNQAVAGVGFQPDFVMFLWSYIEAVDTSTSNSEMGIGFARSAASRGAFVVAGRDNNGNNHNKRWQQRTDSVILLLDPTVNPPSQDAVADIVSMDANGFTINKSDAPANSTPIFFLALKGGRHNVGAFNQPVAAGTQSVAGVGFKPAELILSSFNYTATTAIIGDPAVTGPGAVSFGAARSPAARGGIWFQDRSDLDPSEANMYTSTSDILTLALGPATVNARSDLFSFDTNGFTLNWTSAAAPARQILYWAIGSNVSVSKIDWRGIY